MFELRDEGGLLLAATDDRAEAVRILRAFVATAPGREDEITLVTRGPDGRLASREDIFDL